MTLRENIQQSVAEWKKGWRTSDLDVQSWFQYFIQVNLDSNKIINYPQVQLPEYEFPDMEAEDLLEDLDLENCGVLRLKDNSIIFCGGGDWQNPMKVEMIYDETTDQYTCKVLEEGYYSDGISNEEFLNALETLSEDQPAPTTQQAIRTADCVNAIVEYYKTKKIVPSSPLLIAKNWKRASKKGSGIIYREFRNIELGIIVTVIASPYKIIKISE